MTHGEEITLRDYVGERFDAIDERMDRFELSLVGVVHWKDLAMAISTSAVLLGALYLILDHTAKGAIL